MANPVNTCTRSRHEQLANELIEFDSLNVFKIDIASLEEASSCLRTACEMKEMKETFGVCASDDLCSAELSLTALLACHLDRFLFSNSRNGLCLHQGPIRKRITKLSQRIDEEDVELNSTGENPEACDIYICSSVAGGYGTPVVLGDANTELQHAIRETGLYCRACLEVHSYTDRRVSPVVLGIPCTKTESELRLYLEGEEKLLSIPICQDQPLYSKPLCALYCGVHFIINNCYHIASPMTVAKPLRDATLEPLKWGPDCRVFWNSEDDLVYKFYSTQERPYEKPNQEYFENANVVEISSDVKLLTYKHVDGSHKPKSVSQFSGALNALASLHKLELVHGDVRLENIVFYGETSVLIDYDLVSKEMSRYPPFYNSSLDCRHQFASSNRLMYRQHDIYSLVHLIIYESNIKCNEEIKSHLTYLLDNVYTMNDKLEVNYVAGVLGIALD